MMRIFCTTVGFSILASMTVLPIQAKATFFLNEMECNRAVKPFCADKIDTFENIDKHDMCSDHMRQYEVKAREYISCLNFKVRSAKSGLSEMLEAWERRSCDSRLDSGIDC